MKLFETIEKTPNSILIIVSVVLVCILPLLPQNSINLLDSLLIRHLVLGGVVFLTFVDFRFALMLVVVYFIAINTFSRETYESGEDSLKPEKKISFDISIFSKESKEVAVSPAIAPVVASTGAIKGEDIITPTPPSPQQESSDPTDATKGFTSDFYYL